MPDILTYAFMQRALLAALLVGIAAPGVGVFLVQRRLSLIGDGLGHVALAGVAVGVLTGTAPVGTALVAAVAAALAIEAIRARGRTSGDIALAVMFYGGIAAGVVILSQSDRSGAALTSYLFGAITTTSTADLITFAVLAGVVLLGSWLLRPWLFAVANDEEYARAAGLPVTRYNALLGILTAVTVVVSMRVVGLLLISALMILPNAAAQQWRRSFAAATRLAIVIGVLVSVAGVWSSYYLATPSGGSIVLLAVAVFIISAVARAVTDRVRRAPAAILHGDHEHGPGCGHEPVEHDGHVDYLHDGEWHAPHEEHYHVHGAEPGSTDARKGPRVRIGPGGGRR